MIMKLRYFLLAMLAMTATTLSAQTMTTASWASKARSARSVANDLRQKKVQKATTTVLKDKDVRSRIKLDKDLEPTLLQAQSRDWASRCCGIDLGVLFKGIDQALQRRKEQKVREQIARELEELKATAVIK